MYPRKKEKANCKFKDYDIFIDFITQMQRKQPGLPYQTVQSLTALSRPKNGMH